MCKSVLAFLGSAIIFCKMIGLKKLTDLYRIYNSLIYKKNYMLSNLVHWQSPLVLTCLQLFSDLLQTCQGPRWSPYLRLIWLWSFCVIKYVHKGPFNSLAPGRFEWHFRWIIFMLILDIDDWCISCEIANVDPDLCHHMASLGHNESMKVVNKILLTVLRMFAHI